MCCMVLAKGLHLKNCLTHETRHEARWKNCKGNKETNEKTNDSNTGESEKYIKRGIKGTLQCF